MAAKAEKFNLMDLLNQRSKQKQEAEEQHPAAEGTQEERTEENKQQGNNVFMVDAYDMIPSKDNFYHVDAALKRSIELVGILQPCIVKKPVNGKYDVIAGHRRRLASLALVEEGKEQFRYIPCMYKKEETADKLAIIMANSFRDKTDFEKMVEIIQLKELVRDIKKEYNLAGRVREMQEELTGITKAQISRYEAIYNNLEKELMEEFKAGRLIMSVAVEVSGMEHECRGALEEAWKSFRMYREWMINDFCQPIYEEWLSEAVAKERISAPGFFTDPLRRKAFCKAQWNGPARGLLNPVQEVTAAEKRVQNGFSTRANETMEMTGTDYYENCRQLEQEEKRLKGVKDIANSTAGEPATGK